MQKTFPPEKNTRSILVFVFLIAVVLSSAVPAKSTDAAQTPQARPRAVLKMTSARDIRQLPANLPLPVYTNNVVNTSYKEATSTKGPSNSATTQTTDSPDIAYQWYQTTLARGGWEVERPSTPGQSELQREGMLYMLKAKKDNYGLFVVCTRPPHAPYTVVTVNLIRR